MNCSPRPHHDTLRCTRSESAPTHALCGDCVVLVMAITHLSVEWEALADTHPQKVGGVALD
jgi:hypothetical protein